MIDDIDDEDEVEAARPLPAMLTTAYVKRVFPDARVIVPRRYQGVDWQQRPFDAKILYYGAGGDNTMHACQVIVRPRRRDPAVMLLRHFTAGRLRCANLAKPLVFTAVPYVKVAVGAGFRVPWNAALVGRHRGGEQWIIYTFGSPLT